VDVIYFGHGFLLGFPYATLACYHLVSFFLFTIVKDTTLNIPEILYVSKRPYIIFVNCETNRNLIFLKSQNTKSDHYVMYTANIYIQRKVVWDTSSSRRNTL